MSFKYYLLVVILLLLTSDAFAEDFLKTLEDGSVEEKIEAMYNTGYAGNKAVFWYFVKYLSYTPKNGDNQLAIRCREAAAEGLGRINDKRAIPYLIEQYKKEKNIAVKRKIMFAFRRYRDAEIIPLVEDAISSSDPDLRFQGVMTASFSNNEDYAVKVSQLLENEKDSTVKLAGIYCLANIGSDFDNNFSQLLKALHQKEPELRYWAAQFIRVIDNPKGIDDLVKALEIENKIWVRNEMELALSTLYVSRKANSDYYNNDYLKQKD